MWWAARKLIRTLSLPVRERGLKSASGPAAPLARWSLPVRERGLKSAIRIYTYALQGVAPRAGAWIEITAVQPLPAISSVAPRAGAWIEITLMVLCWKRFESLPVRERGLKYDNSLEDARVQRWSLPVRERGLKSLLFVNRFSELLSLPVRERGLK